ncbi:hypothetical protein [Streptomyces clavuligerus]|uniref:hypothetical protein n=1 Tax=Streptomyces clavuligerus TaxID=1901 RepID=UPI001E4EA3E5|nr:hypothetical protein [Streptomyces clavuligerus]
MGTRSAMRRLRDELARALEQARPTEPQEVFAALCTHLGERRGRPVVLRMVDFPPQTASGLYLNLADRDVICVQTGTPPLHQLIIFGHEVWHMVAGHAGPHDAGPAQAAGLVTGGAPGPGPAGDTDGTDGMSGTGGTAPERGPFPVPDTAVQHLAARTDFRQAQENEAEAFGLELGAHLRHWLEPPPRTAAPRSPEAQRIQRLLGHRRD